MSKIGIVLVVYNFNKTELMLALESLISQTDCVCVVDNSATDSSSIFEGMEKVVYIPLMENRGIAEAQNIGIQYFIDNDYEYLVFSDQDSKISEGTIQGLLNTYLELQQQGYNVGAVGPRPYNKQTKQPYSHLCNKVGEFSLPSGTQITEVTYTMSSLSLQKVEAFKEIGLMDGPLFIDSVECEWCWRATRMKGMRFFVDEDIHLDHFLGIATKKILGKDRSITPPYRLRTQIRNYLWLRRRDYVPKGWLRYNGKKYLAKMFYYPVFGGDFRNYVKYIYRGIKEGCKSYPGSQVIKSTILLLTFLLSSISMFAAAEMPIIAYLGVPYDRSNDENYKALSECGFNVNLYDYQTIEQMQTAMTYAAKYGVKIIGHCPESHQRPQYAARVLKDNPAFFGYLLKDEPSAELMPQLQKEIELIKAVDNSHCFYMNLLPYYDKGILEKTGTETYEEYVDMGVRLSTQQVSFDFYPITTEGLRVAWYNNLEVIRSKSISVGKPFWGFVLCVPHIVYPQPTMGGLRMQVYTNLAYGAQAIQYFAYWTPLPDDDYDYHNGPITNDGKKTSTYYLVKKMNQELRAIAPLFYGATVTAVNHLGNIPPGTKRLESAPENLRILRISGKQGAIVSQFTKDGHRYVAVVNRDYEDKMKLHIEAKSSSVLKVNTDLSLQSLYSDYKIPAGGMMIFRLE